MDILTLKMALAKGAGLDPTFVKAVNDADLDAATAIELLLNAFRQHVWQNEEDAPICEAGSVTLTNTAEFPFNDSQQTVALVKPQEDINYAVITQVESDAGNIGEIHVSGKQVNGFKLDYAGSAKSATINYIVIGGIV